MDNVFRKNFFQNAGIASVLQIVNIFVAFVVRLFFIRCLGNAYLSVNGLFTNIVSLLSFAELGIGNAVIFSLYKPLAKNDTEQINSLMWLYKRAYRGIRIVILVLGLVCLNFVDKLVTDIEISEDIKHIFLLFLINTYVSYFYAYKKSFLIADKKNYIAASIQQGISVVQAVLQCGILAYFQDFTFFLIIQIVCTILTNVLTSVYVDKHYRYLKEKWKKPDKQLAVGIIENIKNIFLYKLGAVILNSTDNILISALVATKLVGIYSNYSMVVNALNSVLMQACNSISATIGNYNIQNSAKDNEKTFKWIFVLSYWMFSMCAVCLTALLNPFVDLCFGQDYLLPPATVIIISMVFYITGINQIPSQYRSTFGLFRQARWVPMTAAILNVIFSIVLGKYFGLNGIFLATIIAKVLTFNIVDPILIYKNGFHKSCRGFFSLNTWLLLLLILNIMLTNSLVQLITHSGIQGFVLRTIVAILCSNMVCLVFLGVGYMIKEVKPWLNYENK